VTHDFAVPTEGAPFATDHTVTVPVLPPPAPPLPCLISIEAGRHPIETPPYDQLSFRFSGAFPGYRVAYGPAVSAGTGAPVQLPGAVAVLRVEFRQAQAHNEDGSSCIRSATPSPLDFPALQSYALASDFEGVVVYGVGIGNGSDAQDGQARIRVTEDQEVVNGEKLFVILDPDRDRTAAAHREVTGPGLARRLSGTRCGRPR
jgi:hypothetical protein